MNTHVVVPARLSSTRLPDKPLADICGLPMIVRVAHRANSSKADSVVIAVDDQRVLEVVQAAGFEAMMTARDHPSGSDRVMEVAASKGWSDDDIVINVQGDEPLLPTLIIEQLSDFMSRDAKVEIATLSEPLESHADFLNPNVVKVVTDDNQQALYFSRAPIPYPRDAMQGNDHRDTVVVDNNVQRHVGVYAFRVKALAEFVQLKQSRLEHIERLEQLRWLEKGGRIAVLPSAEPIPGGVDTPEDLERVRAIVRTHASASSSDQD